MALVEMIVTQLLIFYFLPQNSQINKPQIEY